MTQDTIKDRLRAARALIDQPGKWTRGANRRDAKGNFLLRGTKLEVASRCTSGVIDKACQGYATDTAVVRKYLLESINRQQWRTFGLVNWNDAPDRTHAEVMQAFDRAIADTHPG